MAKDAVKKAGAKAAAVKRPANDGYVPFAVRFKAWWEGVDAAALMHKGAPPPAPAAAGISVESEPEEDEGRWSSGRLSLCQRLWETGDGDEVVHPGGADYTVELAKPMALDNSKSAADLSAGLGGGTRKLAASLDLWITGFESDSELADHAMALSRKHGHERRAPIAALDEESFDLGEKRMDGVLMRERLFRFHNKQRALDCVFRALKPRGHLVLTDFVLADEAAAEDPAVSGWLKREAAFGPTGREPALWTKADVKKALVAKKLDLRIFEDESEKYLGMIRGGWAHFVDGLDKGEMTRRFVDDMMREAEYWLHLGRALESGKLIYLRAHAIRGGETL
ncbi:MAG: class I SAM-dependent methyltransferase [Marivibrio sp.]|uniref:class I SAM-dependent methyltransferase n=1 Tax=Marivibrio sp. TaxID=2039719 RepID=UPI0032EF07B3